MSFSAEDPKWVAWQQAAPAIYEKIYYQQNSLVAHVNGAGHRLIERDFGQSSRFDQVLEVGAGTGIHLDYVQHGFDRYVVTDISAKMLAKAEERHAGRANLAFQVADATALPFEDNSFDRLVSVYNLEHLPQPHRVLEEWKRVVRPGGDISIAVPTEGGIAWNLGRHLTTRRDFAKHGLDLDYIISREHINACYRLRALIQHTFPNRREQWFPLMVPTPHINLVLAVNATVE
jgi:SAM-dependent methyltransferase